jgi:hypothetical protein
MASERREGLISQRSLRTLIRALRSPDVDLTAKESASTLFRFFRSKHVIDLKLIVAAAVLFLGIHIVVVLFAGLLDIGWMVSASSEWNKVVEFFKFIITYIAPTIPIYGAILAWAYLSAAGRLGIVDLFACEISTLCRVGTIFDVGKHYVDQHKTPLAALPARGDVMDKAPASSTNFVSQEDYFPVFSGNSRDLQLLEASVVKNITAFYTFMKAMRDSQRKLAGLSPSQGSEPGAETLEAEIEPSRWHAGITNVIYMLYLGYESGRKSVEDLIEFEPEAADSRTVILLTELKCYSFLIEHFKHDDLRHSRLRIREELYKKKVPELYIKVNLPHDGNEIDWEPAKRTAPELARLYKDTFGEDMADAISRLGKSICKSAG